MKSDMWEMQLKWIFFLAKESWQMIILFDVAGKIDSVLVKPPVLEL